MDFDQNADANINPVGYILNAQLKAKVNAAVQAQEIHTKYKEFQDFLHKNSHKKKSRKSQKHCKAFLKDKVNLGSNINDDEQAQLDANSVYYLKTHMQEDQKNFKINTTLNALT